MQLVDSMVKRTNEQLTESTGLLQEILRAAADPQAGQSGGLGRGRAGRLRLSKDGFIFASQESCLLPSRREICPTPSLSVSRNPRLPAITNPAVTSLCRQASGSCPSAPTSWRR